MMFGFDISSSSSDERTTLEYNEAICCTRAADFPDRTELPEPPPQVKPAVPAWLLHLGLAIFAAVVVHVVAHYLQ